MPTWCWWWGRPNSSNSVRLVEVALKAGARAAHLVPSAEEIDWNWLDGVTTLGVSAGASAPEDLVEDLIAAMAGRYAITIREVTVAREDVVFKLPKEVA